MFPKVAKIAGISLLVLVATVCLAVLLLTLAIIAPMGVAIWVVVKLIRGRRKGVHGKVGKRRPSPFGSGAIRDLIKKAKAEQANGNASHS